MNLAQFHKWSYIIMGALTLIMVIAVIAVSASGDNDLLKGPFTAAILGVYLVIQIACIILMKPSLSIYKVGFYLLHIGLPLILFGLFLFEAMGETLSANVPENSTGSAYTRLQRENGSFAEFGFGIRLNQFTVEKYESGGDSYYGANISIFEENERTGGMTNSENIMLEVNKTYRNNGWKIYLMSYDNGSAALPITDSSSPLPETYTSVGGGGQVAAIMMSTGKYDNATVNFFVYNAQSGAYAFVGNNLSAVAGVEGKCTATVYDNGDGTFSAYFSQTYVNLLFKRDPGEYVVLVGMVMTLIGVILMCIIRGKKGSKSDDDSNEDKQRKSRHGKRRKEGKC